MERFSYSPIFHLFDRVKKLEKGSAGKGQDSLLNDEKFNETIQNLELQIYSLEAKQNNSI